MKNTSNPLFISVTRRKACEPLTENQIMQRRNNLAVAKKIERVKASVTIIIGDKRYLKRGISREDIRAKINSVQPPKQCSHKSIDTKGDYVMVGGKRFRKI